MSQVKQALGLVGLLAAIAGVALESRLGVWVAIGVLAASAVIRLVGAVRARRAVPEAEESDG